MENEKDSFESPDDWELQDREEDMRTYAAPLVNNQCPLKQAGYLSFHGICPPAGLKQQNATQCTKTCALYNTKFKECRIVSFLKTIPLQPVVKTRKTLKTRTSKH